MWLPWWWLGKQRKLPTSSVRFDREPRRRGCRRGGSRRHPKRVSTCLRPDKRQLLFLWPPAENMMIHLIFRVVHIWRYSDYDTFWPSSLLRTFDLRFLFYRHKILNHSTKRRDIICGRQISQRLSRMRSFGGKTEESLTQDNKTIHDKIKLLLFVVCSLSLSELGLEFDLKTLHLTQNEKHLAAIL